MSLHPSLALIASVGRLLNEGFGFEATISMLAETLRTGLPARRVALWLREPGATTFRAVTSPPAAEVATVHGLGELGAPPPDTVRIPLVQSGEELGALEAVGAPEADGPALLRIVGDFLTPFLASAELSADLAHEVAAQSREIEEQRRFTSLIIDSLPVGLYVVDRDYRIQVWNRKRETGTQGMRRSDVVGRRVFDVLSRQPADRMRAEFDRVFETGEILQEEIEVNRGAESRHYRITKIPMRLEADAITHVITIGEDVTESRMSQERIMQSEKLAAIGQLAAGIMHEINNPLATIGACVAAMEGRLDELEGPSLGSVREYLGIIDKEVERCTHIVSGLLDFSRPKGKVKRSVTLNTVVEDALFLLSHHKAFSQLVVTRELDPTLPRTTASAEQLVQVVMALMLNALDAMEGMAGGRLTLRTGRNRARPDEVFVEVEDTGVGIPRSEQAKIFEPFYTTKPPGRGTGLGLSICYGIVREHQGRIEVESQPGQGSLFRVVLPVAA